MSRDDSKCDRVCLPVLAKCQKAFGVGLTAALYVLLAVHVHAYFSFIVGLLFKRLGARCAIAWACIGLTILYNIVYNHVLAMVVRPGSPKDLRKIENLREVYKRRANRKSVKNDLD